VTAVLSGLAIVKGHVVSDAGGGLVNHGTLTINDSIFYGNAATDGGGAIFNFEVLTINDSTFSGNTAYVLGGDVYNDGTFTVSNSTFSGNVSNDGAGIMSTGTLNYANTIIANSSGSDCFQFEGSIGTNTNNLAEDGPSCSASLSGDPSLDVLADNGGPTQTFALLPSSSAIDAGDNATCTASPVNNTVRPSSAATVAPPPTRWPCPALPSA
jgi:hypothetical protein